MVRPSACVPTALMIMCVLGLLTAYYYLLLLTATTLLLTTSQALLAIFGGGYWYIKNGAVTEKGLTLTPMPPLTPAPGTAPGWPLSRSNRQRKRACNGMPLSVTPTPLQRPTSRPCVPEAHGAPTRPGTQSRPPAALGACVPPVSARPQGLEPPLFLLNQQDSDGRPQQRPHLLRQLRHWRIQMGAACLERAAARRRGGWRLERICVVYLSNVRVTAGAASSHHSGPDPSTEPHPHPRSKFGVR